MRNAFILVFACFLTFFSPADSLSEEQQPWGIHSSVGFFTEYIFRGKNVYEGTSIQPATTAWVETGDFGALSGNIWLHTSGEANEPPEKFTELDYTISYDFYLRDLTITAGHIFYTFPGDTGRINNTKEYFVSLALSTLLNPSITFYHDYDEGEYQYYTLGLDENLPLPFLGDDVEVTPHVRFAFATNADDGPIFYTDDGLVHIDTGLSMDFQLGSLDVSPQFNFTFETDDAAVNEFWLGIVLGFSI